MNKHSKEMWKDRQLDEKLQLKYGENWRVIKRSITEFRRGSRPTGQPHSFAHLLNKKYVVEPLGDPQIRRI